MMKKMVVTPPLVEYKMSTRPNPTRPDPSRLVPTRPDPFRPVRPARPALPFCCLFVVHCLLFVVCFPGSTFLFQKMRSQTPFGSLLDQFWAM